MHSAVFTVVRCPSVCLFVCPSVTLVYCVETAKLTRKSDCEIPTGSPQQGRQVEVAYQKCAIFNQYHCVSERCEIGP